MPHYHKCGRHSTESVEQDRIQKRSCFVISESVILTMTTRKGHAIIELT
jgi:hypothetical protein